MAEKRPIITLKRPEDYAPPEDDVRVDLHTYDLLLPCRRYEINYKVALLGNISPTLEFLLRLLKSVEGISEDDARGFFGYSRTEMEFVLNEGTTPGYVDRRESRLWLTTAGENLFSDSSDEPAIFAVERRSKEYGFDQLSLSPERPTPLGRLEMFLPDLSVDSPLGGGNPSKAVRERFRYFFRELGDREEKRSKRRQLYSIDNVVPSDRYQIPVRLKVYCQSSTPGIAEIDLSSWRPDQELADRPEVEKAVGEFVTRLSTNSSRETEAHQIMVDLAPEFFKDYRLARGGISMNRYWRYAVGHGGEVRVDRRTVPIVGSMTTKDNLERLFRVVDTGLRDAEPPPVIVSLPPQSKHWGATTLLRDANTLIKQKLVIEGEKGTRESEAICILTGRPAKYLQEAFDDVASIDTHELPPLLEIYLVPRVAVLALSHAPLGATVGLPAPVGFISFDSAVLKRCENLLVDKVFRYIDRDHLRTKLEQALAEQQEKAE